MSERTTIGGTVYESIGSSSSNLLLKCNGTARIQWGNKLIDLIKNGKIATSESSDKIYVISDLSEIKHDGIYVLTTEKSSQLLVKKDDKLYDLTSTDLYISASEKQDITVKQKRQALENIGLYFNTLEELQSAGIQEGIVYVLEDNNLYVINKGVISEFEAKLKTVTVEKEENYGEVINSSLQIVLSILDEDYVVLSDKRITINQDIHVKDYAQLGSENADAHKGYRLYIDGDISKLDIDEINVRNGLPVQNYVEATFSDLVNLLTTNTLKPNQWYLITDYQNHWKLVTDNKAFNRPILVQARNEYSLCKEGRLFNDQTVTLSYDAFYRESINQSEDTTASARGRITWMKDGDGNEANFDFLDYTNYKGEALATLHSRENTGLDKSIFPKGSYNNKLTVYDLKGTVLKDGNIDDSNTTIVDFQFDDSDDSVMDMHDNIIECRGIVVNPSCSKFIGNTLKEVCNVSIYAGFISNNFTNVYKTFDLSTITSFYKVTDNTIFDSVVFNATVENSKIAGLINSTLQKICMNSDFGVVTNSTFVDSIFNSTFENISNCTFNCRFDSVKFKQIFDCVFNTGNLEHIRCHSDISNYEFSELNYYLLYDTSKVKDVYYFNNEVLVLCSAEHIFTRGMIVMHSGFEVPPVGWAVCDGGSYTYNGVTSQTPDLRNRFIKAVSTQEEVKATTNLNADNEFTLEERHLPKHSHPHQQHTHTISGLSADIENSGELSFVFNSQKPDISSDSISVVTFVVGESVTIENSEAIKSVGINTDTSSDITVIGGNHNHDASISGGTISNTVSKESSKSWNNDPIKLEPNYYSLIFIMKL